MADELTKELLDLLIAVRRLHQHAAIERVTRLTCIPRLLRDSGPSSNWDTDEEPALPIREIVIAPGIKMKKAEMTQVFR